MIYGLAYVFGKILGIFILGGILTLGVSVVIFLVPKILKKSIDFKNVYKKAFKIIVPTLAVIYVLGQFFRMIMYSSN